MTDLGALFELRRAMVAGERTIHDPVAMVTRTERQHLSAIDRAAERLAAADDRFATALMRGDVRGQNRAIDAEIKAVEETARLEKLLGRKP